MLKRILLLIVAFFGCAIPALATTRTADSCSAVDIQAKVNLSVTGDTVLLPDCAGTSITIAIVVTVGVRITATNPCTWGANPVPGTIAVNPSTPTCHSILKNDITRGAAHEGAMFSFTTAAGDNWRIDNLEFIAGAPATQTEGCIQVGGTSTAWRVDHSWFNNVDCRRHVFVDSGATYGVVDHNYFDCTGNASGGGAQTLHHNATTWGGGANNFGDGSWATPTNMGTAAAAYLENNFIKGTNTSATDSEDGGRIVARFNTVINDFFGSHGTESSHRKRGLRFLEVCFNDMSEPGQDRGQLAYYRSGTGVTCLNHSDGYLVAAKGQDFRSANPYTPWGPTGSTGGVSDGTGQFDNNTGGVFLSGKHTGSNGATTLTDSGANFSPYATTLGTVVPPSRGYSGNEYSILNTTQGWSSFITEGTSGTTLTYAPDINLSYVGRTWNTNDDYAIRKAAPVLDQVGRGRGDLLSGGDGVTAPTPTGYPTQAAEPVYVWGNSMTNADGVFPGSSESPHIQTARDIIIDNCGVTPCVTSGTLAAMPGSCTGTLAGYWATDQGSWNAGSNPTYTGQGKLYRCNGSTYAVYYMPYTFPHPLTADACTPDHLAWDTQPSSVGLGSSLGSLQIGVYDSGSNKCTGDSSTVTIAKKGGTCTGMTLNGTVSGAASSGTFTTSDVTLTVATGSCTLTATDGALTSADSNAFTISSVNGGLSMRLRLKLKGQ